VLIEVGLTNSGDVKGTIRSDVRCLPVSTDVRRHRLISISYISLLPCHRTARGYGREREGVDGTGRNQTFLYYAGA